MKVELSANNQKMNWIYALVLIVLLAFMLIWRFFGITALDSRVSDGISNYPALAGVIGVLIGLFFTKSNLKKHKTSGESFALIDCWRSVLLVVTSGIVFVCAITL